MDAEEKLLEPEDILSNLMGSEEEMKLRLQTHLDIIGLSHLIVS